MSGHEETFIPDDPGLYGPDPASRAPRPWRLAKTLGLSLAQSMLVLAASMLIFAFLGGPFWSAPRQGFPLRVFVSYLAIPPLVVILLRWNGVRSWATALFAASVLGSLKFAATVAIDVVQGLLRHWPP